MGRRASSGLAVLAAALCAGAGAGCGVGTGTGRFGGTLFITPCTEDSSFGSAAAPVMYEMQPTFFAAQPLTDLDRPNPTNRLSIHIQSSGNLIEEADALIIQVTSSRDVAAMLGQPLELGPSTNVRATLSPLRTCPLNPVQIELDGTITFQRFGSAQVGVDPPIDFYVHYDEPLTGTLDVQVVDRRALTLGGTGATSATPSVGGALSGTFDFLVRQSKAAQLYP